MQQIVPVKYKSALDIINRTKTFNNPFRIMPNKLLISADAYIDKYGAPNFCDLYLLYWVSLCFLSQSDPDLLYRFFGGYFSGENTEMLDKILEALTGHPELEEQLSGFARLSGQQGIVYFLTEILGIDLK